MRKATSGAALAALSCLLLAPGQARDAAAQGATGLRHIHLETLERSSPGWNPVETTGDEKSGSVVIERVVWPLFYLHWHPLRGGVGEKLTIAEAEKAVAGLWEGMTFDSPPQGRKVSLPAHEGVAIDATLLGGGWKTTYLVWACPVSGRLFVADMNASLQVMTPPLLTDQMTAIARSVTCHEGATIEESPWFAKRRQIANTGISYGLPFAWFPVEGYRIQKVFGGGEFSAADHAPVTRETGQDLSVALDSLRRLHLFWEPAPDEAMTFARLTEAAESFWKKNATDIMSQGSRVSNGVWIMDGLARTGKWATPFQSGTHKFRAWAWRKDGMSYFAVGELGGARVGRRVMTQIQEISDLMLEEMFQAIDY